MHDEYSYLDISLLKSLHDNRFVAWAGIVGGLSEFVGFYLYLTLFLSEDAQIVNNERSDTSGPNQTEESCCKIQAFKESI